MTESPGMLVAQRYRLVRVIGAGGMGRVWLGHDELIDREVAIKELLFPPGLDDQQRASLSERAIREARAAGRLSHPGIVTVHDVVEFNGAPMIVMEFVRGGSLADAIQTYGGLQVEQVARIGTQILDALRVAHQAGIVHRDLKPANVLLAEDRVVITDFGIARLIGEVQLTVSGTVVGSPQYMAPEQASTSASTPASDLWSLGATLYTAVEGRPPFEGADVMATLSALLTTDPPPPQRAGRLSGVITALLSKDPARRPTAEQAAVALSSPGIDLETQRVGAYPVGPAPVAYPDASKGNVRRRTMLLAAGGGALAAIGVAAWLISSKDDQQNPASTNTASTNPASQKANATTKPSRETEPSDTGAATDPGKPAEITDHIQLTGHEHRVTSVSFSPDGKLLASGDDDLSEKPMARLWDTSSGKQIATLTGPPGTGGASADVVAFSPDGKLLAVGGNFLGDSTRLWNVADRQLIGALTDSGSIMKSLAFSPDGKLIAGATHGGTTKVWDVASRQVKIGIPDGGGFRNVTFSPDGTLLANCDKEADIRLSDPATGRTVRTIKDATGSDVSFSPDGKSLAVPDADGKNTLQIYDVATGQSKAVFDRVEDITTTDVLFSPDGKTIAAWGLGNVIHLWDVAGKHLRAILVGSAAKVNTVVFDPSGKRLASAGDDKVIRIWNIAG
ncbi:serine/threonine-protein kinase [Actinocrispum sp. NPDC049592]|uniref:WD40 repeat domain-containing serine/threonine protein kinase n=1 Tax=Actinocrispum sp. NPDC049592 TaxID=3154835 RepID=UPI00342E7D20